jgi:hypothetical protein
VIGAAPPLSELALSFTPLDYVTEWSRCGDTADYLARFFAYNFEDRETAANVLSTTINELLENVVKFSDDKSRPSRVRVLQFDDHVRVETTNGTSAAQARVFAGVLERIVVADPEELFAALVAAPPPTGGPGIGLVMLRKDYAAELSVRIDAAAGRQGHEVEVVVCISNAEVEQR